MEITRKALIRLTSIQSSVETENENAGELELVIDEETGEPIADSEKLEIESEGLIRITDERIELEYFETELTGMEGSCTSIGFDKNEPGLVTMLRTGSVETALVFEEGERHICAYNTEVIAFEICVHTFGVKNELTENGGKLELDYALEFRGASTEHTSITVDVTIIGDGN